MNNGINKRIAITLIVMVLLFTFSFMLSKSITDIAEESCWDELHNSISKLSAEIVLKVNCDQALLSSITDIIAKEDSIVSAETRNIIDSFRPNNTIANIALLLPGDMVMLPGEGLISSSGLLSFEEESAFGRHISNRSVDIRDKNRLILRNFVPVIKNGETIAMLYSVVDLENLPEHIAFAAYDKKAAINLIDGAPGNFLLDT